MKFFRLSEKCPDKDSNAGPWLKIPTRIQLNYHGQVCSVELFLITDVRSLRKGYLSVVCWQLKPRLSVRIPYWRLFTQLKAGLWSMHWSWLSLYEKYRTFHLNKNKCIQLIFFFHFGEFFNVFVLCQFVDYSTCKLSITIL